MKGKGIIYLTYRFGFFGVVAGFWGLNVRPPSHNSFMAKESGFSAGRPAGLQGREGVSILELLELFPKPPATQPK